MSLSKGRIFRRLKMGAVCSIVWLVVNNSNCFFLDSKNLVNVGRGGTASDYGAVCEMRMNESIVQSDESFWGNEVFSTFNTEQGPTDLITQVFGMVIKGEEFIEVYSQKFICLFVWVIMVGVVSFNFMGQVRVVFSGFIIVIDNHTDVIINDRSTCVKQDEFSFINVDCHTVSPEPAGQLSEFLIDKINQHVKVPIFCKARGIIRKHKGQQCRGRVQVIYVYKEEYGAENA